MNMFKYLLLSVVCTVASLSMAQEPIVSKSEDAVITPAQEPVVAQTEVAVELQPVVNDNSAVAPVQEAVAAKAEAVVEPQPVVNEGQVVEGQDDDFADWVKSLEMSDEEKAQILAELDAEMDNEIEKATTSVNEKVEDKKQKQALPEVKTAPVKPELPETVK